MISINGATISVEGTRLDLMTDLTVIIRSMLDQGIIDEKTLNYTVELATSDKEKLDRDLREAIALASILFGDIK